MDDLERIPRRIARLVCMVETRTDADDDVQHVLEPQHVVRGRADDPAEVLAVDVLHREEVLVVLEADVVDRGDVRVLERGDQPRLVEQHPHEPLVLRLLREDALQRDELREATDAVGAREEQLRHAAGAERSDERVAPQPLARFDGGVESHPTPMMPYLGVSRFRGRSDRHVVSPREPCGRLSVAVARAGEGSAGERTGTLVAGSAAARPASCTDRVALRVDPPRTELD